MSAVLIYQLISVLICIFGTVNAFVDPSYIYLGGSFRVVYINSTSGHLGIDEFGHQHRLSFLAAINQINNKTDGFYDDILPNTIIKYAVEWGQKNVASNPTNNLYYGGSLCSYYIHSQFPSVSMVITSSPYETTSALEEIFIGWDVPILISNSTRTEFSHGLNFPYSLRIPAADSYDAVVIASLIHNYYKWNKVSVFYTTDTYGQDSYYEFTKYGDIYGLEYLSVYPLSIASNNYEKIVENVELVGSTIFVMLMDISYAETFLLTVYNLGMLKLGTQVIGTSKMATSILWENFPSNEINEIMKGVIVVQYSPKLYFELPLGNEFVNIVKGFSPGLTYDSNGTQVCSKATDSAGSSLYHIVYNNIQYCTGFDENTIESVTSATIDPSAMMTYNSVITYAMAADYLIRNEIEVTGANIHGYLTNGTIKFHNSSVGEISFSDGDSINSEFGLGDRQTGQIYEIANFQNVTSGFVTVGVWSSNSTGFSCYDEIILPSGSFNISYKCNKPIYRTYDSISQPLDHKNDIYIKLNSNLKSYYITMGILIIIENIIFMSIMIYFRHTKAVKNGQLLVMLTVNIGVLLGAIRPIMGALPISIENCQVQLFVEHLCFRLLLGTIMLKLWRIDKIVNALSFKRVKILEFDLLKIIGYHLILLFIILFFIIGFGGVAIGQDTISVSNQTKITKICLFSSTPVSKIVVALLYILEGFYLLMACYYLFKTRAVPASVNETAIIGPTLLGLVVSIAVIAAIILALSLKASIVEMVINLTFTILLFIGSAFYYISKLIQILEEIEKKITKKQYKANQVLPFIKAIAIVLPKKDSYHLQNKIDEDEDMVFMKKQVKLKLDYLEKAKYLQHHMDICKILLMAVADDEDSLDPGSHASKENVIDSSLMLTDNNANMNISHSLEGQLHRRDKNEIELSGKLSSKV